MLVKLFNDFARELEYLRGTSKQTIKSYRLALDRYIIACGDILPTKELLGKYVVSMRERGLSVTTCNISIRSINSFLTWLAENEHCPKLRMKQLKEDKRVIPDVSLDILKRIINYQPKAKGQKRVWSIVMILIDSGCRINEILSLKRSQVDLENFLMQVTGKGNKERVIPISNEVRKILYKQLQSHNHELVFCTKYGDKITYFNIRRDFFKLCKKVGIEPVPFHQLRHNYALNFIRNGGDVFSLKRILGHASLQTTMGYVNSNTDDLKIMHKKTSILSRLR